MRPLILLTRVFLCGLALLVMPFAASAKGGHGGGGHGGGHSSHGGSATSFSSGHSAVSSSSSATRSAASTRGGSGCSSRDERGNCQGYGARGAADRSPEMRAGAPAFGGRDTEISIP